MQWQKTFRKFLGFFGNHRKPNIRFAGQKVMLDSDLARLYGTKTKILNQATKRNEERFPEDFMFQLTLEETNLLFSSRSHSATLKRGQNVKYLPYAFTEHGALMLANVLKSPVAVRASIEVVRAFTHMRQLIATNEALIRKVEALEQKVGNHDADLRMILAAIRKLLQPPPRPSKRPMGFR